MALQETDESWRDRPATMGDLYDAMMDSATRAEAACRRVEESLPNGYNRQILRYAGRVQTDLFMMTAANLKEQEGVS